MKNIVLIGMSGSGKSTVGKYLASKLSKTCLDTDDIIISNTGYKINHIFNNYGEDYFRQLEKLVISSLYKRKGIIVSTGGGVILDPENVTRLKENGIIFFLNGSIYTLYKNLKGSETTKEHRPLLGAENLKGKLEEMYRIRKRLYYTSSDYEISTDNRSVEEIGNEIIKIFNAHSSCS